MDGWVSGWVGGRGFRHHSNLTMLGYLSVSLREIAMVPPEKTW